MKYKIWCNQRQQYFADDSEFETFDDIRDQLISYHEVDIEDQDKETFSKMKLSEILEMFEWEIHDEKGNYVEVI